MSARCIISHLFSPISTLFHLHSPLRNGGSKHFLMRMWWEWIMWLMHLEFCKGNGLQIQISSQGDRRDRWILLRGDILGDGCGMLMRCGLALSEPVFLEVLIGHLFKEGHCEETRAGSMETLKTWRCLFRGKLEGPVFKHLKGCRLERSELLWIILAAQKLKGTQIWKT